jgi:butyryl-CoA dehydrogenase
MVKYLLTMEEPMDFELTPQQIELKERAREAGLAWRGMMTAWDREDASPYEQVAKSLREAGLLGLTMPKKYGGQGLTALEYVLVVEELFVASQSWILGEPLFCSTGPGPSILAKAQDERTLEKYMPDVVSANKGVAIALTEPLHGSDLTHLETTAVIDGNDIILNGSKRFITGAPENELYAVFARFDDIPGAKGIGCVIVEKGTDGLKLEKGVEWLGARGLPHGEVHMSDCRVPMENLVRGPGGFAELMTAFNMERLHNSTYSLAFAEVAYEETVAYCEQRKSFDREVIEFQSTYHALVDMYVAIEAQRLLTYRAAVTSIDGVFPRPLEVSVSKLFGSEMLPQLTLTAMTLHGGDGVTMDFPIQRIHRDGVTAMVAGGSPAVLKNSIAAQLFPHRRFPQTRQHK